ncbi:MAG: hypothetical protein ACPL2E_08180, partial [Conexivisphaera sp.]
SGSDVVKLLEGIKGMLDGAYGQLQRKPPEAKRIEVKRAEDLPDRFRDFLNDAVNLLPLYNRFTFFIQSLNFTPKVYLKLMYCDDLFGERAQDLMNRHGIRLIPKLQPRIWKGVSELDDDFTIIGHAPNSFGDYLVKVIHNIYELTRGLSELYRGGIGVKINDELAKYIKQYSHYLDPLHRELIGGELPSYAYYGTYLVIITRDDGTLILNDVANRSKYTSYLGLMLDRIRIGSKTIDRDKFVQLFSAPMFLGLIPDEPGGDNSRVIHLLFVGDVSQLMWEPWEL